MSDIFSSIQQGDVEQLRRALDEDPSLASSRNEQGISAVAWAAYHGRRDLVEAVLAKHPELDVFDACVLGDQARVRLMLEEDPTLVSARSPDGFTPLQLACHFGHAPLAKYLVVYGADLEVASDNAMGVTALHAAAAANQTTVVQLLLEAGANVNAAEHDGYTALHLAAANGNGELVDLLLESGADRAATLEDGKTPADLAREKGHEELAAGLS